MTMILILSEFNDLNRGNNKIELTNKIMVVFKWECFCIIQCNVGINFRQTPIINAKHSGNDTYCEESLLLFRQKSRRNSI